MSTHAVLGQGTDYVVNKRIETDILTDIFPWSFSTKLNKLIVGQMICLIKAEDIGHFLGRKY